MNVPLLDLKKQYEFMKEDMDATVARVIASQYFILGEEVKAFESEVSGYMGASDGVGVASGTDALVLALRACGIGEGDEVITTPFTFFATAESISSVGARPVFVDIDPVTYNLDTGKIKAALTSKTRAIIPVHIYGQSADMDPIMEIAAEKGLRVIEDCAQSMGAEYKGTKCGAIGDVGCLSFFPSKNLGGFGDGGMVVTNDSELADKVRKLRVHGSDKQYVHDLIGYNSRLDAFQAAVLRVKLPYLDEWIDARRKNAAYYRSRFAEGEGNIVPPAEVEGAKHTYHQYTIRSSDRDALLAHLNEKGVGARIYYPVPMHLQPCYKDLGYAEGDMPESEKACGEVLSLPAYPELTEEQLEYTADTVAEFSGGRKE